MTELEQNIYDYALKVIPKDIKEISKIKTDSNIIILPFHCYSITGVSANGTNIIFNKKLNRFTKIQYRLGLKHYEFDING